MARQEKLLGLRLYLVSIKGNQGNLEAEVHNYFQQVHEIEYKSEEFKCHSNLDKGHGRIESRHICVTQDLDWLPQKDEWRLKSLIEVRSERFFCEKTENSIRYYGCSRFATAEEFGDWISLNLFQPLKIELFFH